MDKYKINEQLDKLNVRDYRKAIKIIPKTLQVSVNTFHNYRRIQVGDKQDIPYEKVRILEMLFQTDGLENYKIETKSLAELVKRVC